MSKTVADENLERKTAYGTLNNTFKMFPVGTRVKIICVCRDMTFFKGNELGTVSKNSGDYLGIIVDFDDIDFSFNFAPEDLIVIREAEKMTKVMADKVSKHYATKDTGKREKMTTGSQRDTQTGKPRYDLIPADSLKRLADLYARGAEKYDDNNWRKGQPYSRVTASLLRHVYAFIDGDESEDHLAAIAWNAFAIMHFQDTNRTELDDMETLRK
jgi:hypothetical protein